MIREKEVKVIYFIVIVYILYNLQGVLYSVGSIISQTLLFILLFICGFYCIKTVFILRNNFIIYSLVLFLLINIGGYVFYTGVNSYLAFSHLKGIMTCFLPFFITYYIAKKGTLGSNIFEIFFYALLVLYIIMFGKFQNEISVQYDTENVVNNISYCFVRLIPLLFFVRRKWFVNIILLSIITFFVITGAKRGAIITGLLGICIYIFYLFKLNRNKSLYSRLAFFFILIFCLFYFAEMFFYNEYVVNRFMKLSEGDISERDFIYKKIFSTWFNSPDIFHTLFGFGFISSVKITNSLAHNDWLELLSNFGLVGVFCYLILFLSFARFIRNKNLLMNEKFSYFTIIVIWFFTTFFSTWYNSIDNIPLYLLLGYMIGDKGNKINQI